MYHHSGQGGILKIWLLPYVCVIFAYAIFAQLLRGVKSWSAWLCAPVPPASPHTSWFTLTMPYQTHQWMTRRREAVEGGRAGCHLSVLPLSVLTLPLWFAWVACPSLHLFFTPPPFFSSSYAAAIAEQLSDICCDAAVCNATCVSQVDCNVTTTLPSYFM